MLTIIVNNVSPNNITLEHLSNKIREGNMSILDGEFLHVQCCRYILNFIITDGLKDVHESIAKVRNVMRFVESLLARLEKLKTFVHAIGLECKKILCHDIPTKYNLTFLIVETVE